MRDNGADTQRGIDSAMTMTRVGFRQWLGARLRICALAVCVGFLLMEPLADAQSGPPPEIGETAAIAMADHAIARLWERANRKVMAKHLGAVRLDLYFKDKTIVATRYDDPDNPCTYKRLLLDAGAILYEDYQREYGVRDGKMRAALTNKRYYLVTYHEAGYESQPPDACIFIDAKTGAVLFELRPP